LRDQEVAAGGRVVDVLARLADETAWQVEVDARNHHAGNDRAGLEFVNDARLFQALDKLKMPAGLGGLICLASQVLPLTEKVWSIPVGWI
jgi:hypothetical protein